MGKDDPLLRILPTNVSNKPGNLLSFKLTPETQKLLFGLTWCTVSRLITTKSRLRRQRFSSEFKERRPLVAPS